MTTKTPRATGQGGSAPEDSGIRAPIRVGAAVLLGRGRGMVDVVLPHPTVSQRHAKIFRRGSQVLITDLRSSYGTFVDGKRVAREAVLARGSRIGVGACQFVFDGESLVPDVAVAKELALACLGVTRVVPDRVTGKPLTLLHDVSLAIKPCELVCLIGPSGSGKSTLLSLLCGRVPPNRGRVIYGGRDLHAEFESLKHDLAVVPQREALHQLLTVRQSLWYSAGLRLPSDTSSAELNVIVGEQLKEVGLDSRQNVRVRDLSGGQLKRISLANEIPHKPSLVFLDEVTSGLDELGDEDMMKLFRQLADRGRSVVCITHNTLNIERNAHLVVVLTAGGRLACVGSPLEVCRYFGITRLGDVYGELSKKRPQEWESKFRSHSLKAQYVDSRLPQAAGMAATAARGGFKSVSQRRPVRLTRQLRLLAGRVFALQVMDLKALGMALGQAIFVGGMLAALFGDVQASDEAVTELMNSRNAVFLLLVSIFWLGCNNAAPEIIKERLLFERERAVSVSAGTYYVSKLAVLGGVSLAQAAIVYGLMYVFCNLPGADTPTGFSVQAITVLMVGALGTFMGLAISAQAKSEEMAVRTVPLVLIPQIVLANVIATLEGWLEWVARIFVSTYWSFQAFTSGIENYVKPDEDLSTFLPAALVLMIHYVVLILVGLLGLRPPAGGGGVR